MGENLKGGCEKTEGGEARVEKIFSVGGGGRDRQPSGSAKTKKQTAKNKRPKKQTQTGNDEVMNEKGHGHTSHGKR
ncbi:hypothetical protein ACNIRU_26295, partial [Escherichia coli]